MTASGWRRGRWLEYVLAFAVAIFLARALWWVYSSGQFPQPFFYEADDTFMDWFNTAYWAHTSVAYEAWGTIYPPLSFAFLRYLGKQSCFIGAEPIAVRACDWVGISIIHVIFVINIVLVARIFLKTDRRTSLPRSFALCAGMPMVYALERGNLLLPSFTMVILGFGPLLRSARLRWVCVGAALNFKVYLIGAVGAQLLKRRWLWFEGVLIATVVIYLLSYGLVGAGTPSEIVRNIGDYASALKPSQFLDIWYANTYKPLQVLLEGESLPVSKILGSQVADGAMIAAHLLTRLGQASLVVAAVATWMRPEVVPAYRVAFIGTAMALISSEASGYALMMPIFFVFMEPWKGVGRPIAIICCYVLSLPGDIPLFPIPPLPRDSYWLGHAIEVQYDVALGMFVRPGLLIAMAVALSATTVRAVWADVRH